MGLPVVAIVGRPNVGKSTLFNTLLRRRVAIVEPTPGVTRDRISAVCEIGEETYFELVDTGGMGIVDRDDLSDHVERQIRFAVDRADLVLFLTDARDGITPLDRRVAEYLRPHSTRVQLVANKVDEPHLEHGIGEFVQLGFGEPLPVSALNGAGRHDLSDVIAVRLEGMDSGAPDDPVMKIAIVGKRNAGKSSIVNALVGEERVIVSEVPGTTRDSIDVRFTKDGRTSVVIDTAGVRKRSKLADAVEFYANSRMIDAIRRADVVLLLIDATSPVGQVEKRLAGHIVSEYKPCVVVVNKWDLAKGRASSEDYGTYLSRVLPQLSYAPVAFTSAVEKRNISATIDTAASLLKSARHRVGTGKLNQILRASVDEVSPRPKRGRKSVKCYYATQVAAQPPTIVLMVNHPELITTDYERFLLNRFRERLPFSEVPIRLLFRPRRTAAVVT